MKKPPISANFPFSKITYCLHCIRQAINSYSFISYVILSLAQGPLINEFYTKNYFHVLIELSSNWENHIFLPFDLFNTIQKLLPNIKSYVVFFIDWPSLPSYINIYFSSCLLLTIHFRNVIWKLPLYWHISFKSNNCELLRMYTYNLYF